MCDDRFIYTSILDEPGSTYRDGDMIGYDAKMTVDGREVLIDRWQLECQCPFGILDEFDEWFEWHRRVEFEGEDQLWVTVDMLGVAAKVSRRLMDRLALQMHFTSGVGFLNQAEADYDELRFIAESRYGMKFPKPIPGAILGGYNFF